MAGWKPIATAPRETGRPLLLHPRPRPAFEQPSDEPLPDLTSPAVRRMFKLAEKRGYISYDELNRVFGRLLDLADPAVRRTIRLAKTRGYITSDELNEILPSDEFAPEQFGDVLGRRSGMGINVAEPEKDEESRPAAAAEDQEKRVENSHLAPLATYISVFEGCWDGSSWRTSAGLPCEPTHWMPMPSPPLTAVGW